MNLSLFLIIITLFMVIYSLLAFYASRKVETVTDYFLAGRKLGISSVTFALLATQIGGGMLLGTAQESYSFGLLGIVYNLGMVFGFLLLGLGGVAGRLRALNIATTAELFETRYHSPFLKKCASLLSALTLSGILISQMVGFKALLAGIGIQQEYVFFLFWSFIIFYTMLGGLQSVVIADTYQVCFILVIFAGIFMYGISGEEAGFFSSLIMAHKTIFYQDTVSYARFLPTLIMPALFSLIEQDLAQRFFAARSQAVATISALGAGFFLILFSLVPIYLGMKARLLGLDIAIGVSPLMPAIGALTNDVILIVATCGVIAAISSTADSLLCAVSSNIAQDFDISWLGVKTALNQSRLITGMVGVAALGVSYIMPKNIIEILIASYALSVSCLFVPLIAAYYSDTVKKKAAYGAVVSGFICFIGVRCLFCMNPQLSQPVIIDLLPLGASAVGFLLGQIR